MGSFSKSRVRSLVFLVSVVAGLLLVGSGVADCQETIVLVGSGSTVPQPLYNVWAEDYNKRNPHLQMRYLGLGTSESIRQVSHNSGDFGAGEVRLTPKELSQSGLVLLPTVLVGIVPIYNLPGLQKNLRFSGEVLADIFLGEITEWNDAKIARLNPGVALPDLPIRVIYRPAGKGSNYIFSDYLSKISPKFRAKIGVNASPKWPVGASAERSSDMADKVAKERGAIGYVELSYALKKGIGHGSVQNPAGVFVKASRESLQAACRALQGSVSDDFSTSLTAAPGRDSYPLTSFTWLYLRAKAGDSKRAAALSDLLTWMLSDGQQLAITEGYAELPGGVLLRARRKVEALPR